jgi:hypothetical protein
MVRASVFWPTAGWMIEMAGRIKATGMAVFGTTGQVWGTLFKLLISRMGYGCLRDEISGKHQKQKDRKSIPKQEKFL